MNPLDENTLIALSLSLRALNLRGVDTGQRVIECGDRRFEIAFDFDTGAYILTREIT